MFPFPPERRLKTSSEFDRVFARKRSASDRMLIVYACENGLEDPRIGLVVSRKVGNAVRRNRWKRLLREAFRLHQTQLPRGVDLVCLPQRGAEPELAAIAESLVRLARRAAKGLAPSHARPSQKSDVPSH